MANELPQRKRTRLKYFDYSKTGAYFITVCTHNRKCTLSTIVGTGVPDGPKNVDLLPYGIIAEKYINQLNDFYGYISVDRYVIMPNHIHFILFVTPREDGPSGTPVPTAQNSPVAHFISTFKRFCNREAGKNIWQYRSYDHVIRNRDDYEEICQYICDNPKHWFYDKLYSSDNK